LATTDWKRFSEQLADWERTSSHERFVRLCNAFERSIRRAFRRDPLLDYMEVTLALDCVAQEIARMRREAEGRKSCERIAVELEPGLAERLRQTASRNGLELDELLSLLIDRQLVTIDPLRRSSGGRCRRRAPRDE
jgi:hypothetical protein